ncbi:MAG: hypothetical protein LBE57_04805 [Methanosarcinales archaeon]|jgi:hypothetical protein|nr:hypothetical protein [Methanosarcinales archaeon]
MVSFTWDSKIRRFVCDEDRDLVLSRQQMDKYRRLDSAAFRGETLPPTSPMLAPVAIARHVCMSLLLAELDEMESVKDFGPDYFKKIELLERLRWSDD